MPPYVLGLSRRAQRRGDDNVDAPPSHHTHHPRLVGLRCDGHRGGLRLIGSRVALIYHLSYLDALHHAARHCSAARTQR